MIERREGGKVGMRTIGQRNICENLTKRKIRNTLFSIHLLRICPSEIIVLRGLMDNTADRIEV